jgi:hypothetical protein
MTQIKSAISAYHTQLMIRTRAALCSLWVSRKNYPAVNIWRPTGQVSHFGLFLMVLSLSCCSKEFADVRKPAKEGVQSVSEAYNHFAGGILFPDVEEGLAILWAASFNKKRIYKENLGMFIKGGLLIMPNDRNTPTSAVINVLPTIISDSKLFVLYNGKYWQVLGIVHTHPNTSRIREPTPGHDYQYCFLGIHNYVLGYQDLLDALKTPDGQEHFTRLGPRTAYHKIPWKEYCFPTLPLPSLHSLVDRGNADLSTVLTLEQFIDHRKIPPP